MYKMCSKAERLTQKRIITIEKYSENKIHTICVNKKGANYLYVTWVKMIDLQKILGHQNLYYSAIKKLKIIAIQNILLKNKSKNTKENRSMD